MPTPAETLGTRDSDALRADKDQIGGGTIASKFTAQRIKKSRTAVDEAKRTAAVAATISGSKRQPRAPLGMPATQASSMSAEDKAMVERLLGHPIISSSSSGATPSDTLRPSSPSSSGPPPSLSTADSPSPSSHPSSSSRPSSSARPSRSSGRRSPSPAPSDCSSSSRASSICPSLSSTYEEASVSDVLDEIQTLYSATSADSREAARLWWPRIVDGYASENPSRGKPLWEKDNDGDGLRLRAPTGRPHRSIDALLNEGPQGDTYLFMVTAIMLDHEPRLHDAFLQAFGPGGDGDGNLAAALGKHFVTDATLSDAAGVYLLWHNGAFYIGMAHTFYWRMLQHASLSTKAQSRLDKAKRASSFETWKKLVVIQASWSASLTHIAESILIASSRATEGTGLNSRVSDPKFPYRNSKYSPKVIVQLFQAAAQHCANGGTLPVAESPRWAKLFSHLPIWDSMKFRLLRALDRKGVTVPLSKAFQITGWEGRLPEKRPASDRRKAMERVKEVKAKKMKMGE